MFLYETGTSTATICHGRLTGIEEELSLVLVALLLDTWSIPNSGTSFHIDPVSFFSYSVQCSSRTLVPLSGDIVVSGQNRLAKAVRDDWHCDYVDRGEYFLHTIPSSIVNCDHNWCQLDVRLFVVVH